MRQAFHRICAGVTGLGLLLAGNLVFGVEQTGQLSPGASLLSPGLVMAATSVPASNLELSASNPELSASNPELSMPIPGDSVNLAQPGGRGFLNGLLHSSRLSLDHSVSFGMASGTLGTSHGGLWTSRLAYRVADPLRVSVDVGAMLNTQSGQFLDASNIFLRGVNLDYSPGDKFRLHISYQGAPRGGYAGFDRGSDRPFGGVGLGRVGMGGVGAP